MKKYNLSKIMKRAWEIKREIDSRTRGQLLNIQQIKWEDKLPKNEEVLFSECLKLAWAERKHAQELAEEMEIDLEDACKMAEKETSYSIEWNEFDRVVFTWNVWENYGKRRAYYEVSTDSKYQNGKNRFIDLAA